MTDPIADMLTRIRNAQAAGRRSVEIPFSKLKQGIAAILKNEGFIGTVEKRGGTPAMLVLELQYRGKTPAIAHLGRESTPGHRKYVKAGELPRVLNDLGVAILSTSRGLMTNKEARRLKLGGEVICSVY